MLVPSSKLIIFIHVFFLSVIAVSPFRDATHSESYLRPMSEPLNTQKAQNAQNGFVHLMKTSYASLSRSGYAVHLSWVSFDF